VLYVAEIEDIVYVSAMSVATMCWTTTFQMTYRHCATVLRPLPQRDNWLRPVLKVATDSCCAHVQWQHWAKG